MLSGHVLAQRYSEVRNRQQKKLARINTYKCYKTIKLILKNVLTKSFSPVIKQANISEVVANLLKLASNGEGCSGRKKTI